MSTYSINYDDRTPFEEHILLKALAAVHATTGMWPNFRTANLVLTVNGEEIDTAKFFGEFETAVEFSIERGVDERVEDKFSGLINDDLAELHEVLDDVVSGLRERYGIEKDSWN